MFLNWEWPAMACSSTACPAHRKSAIGKAADNRLISDARLAALAVKIGCGSAEIQNGGERTAGPADGADAGYCGPTDRGETRREASLFPKFRPGLFQAPPQTHDGDAPREPVRVVGLDREGA